MTKKNEKRSFVMYDSFLEAMKHLSDAEFRECVMKIRDYALEGVDEESSSPMVNVIMALAKPNLDSARRRYMASVENGKKGAEFGKLGGAPKGNQNARKKQPLNQPQKQPLDVDDNVDVEEDVNVNEEVDVNEDTPVGDIVPFSSFGFSSFSNSSSSVLREEIESDSERLEEREEKKEPLQEVGKEEVSINSKRNSNNITSDSTASDQGVIGVAARPQQQKEPGIDMSEYLEECIINNAKRLAYLRKNDLPQDDNLFWRTVGFYGDLYGDSKGDAAKSLTRLVNHIIKEGVV